ncbi:hypothetical protein Afil01_24260 [Actinorhabdospora filicis]|uniref:Core-binding (CB) domain-containing protein n=1 Tax=Actinorhabdospora filicis TaxID=1785913 RepID=A0A9W6SL07_9ACTN|nr:hypothetical protein Afil01_24260 [Actinorhabdospora filicis]
MATMDATGRAIDAVWKLESAKIIAALTRLVRDVGLAEELAQDALVAALEQWPAEGVPANPGAWLMTTAKRRAVDRIRRDKRLEERQEDLARSLDQADEVPDDVLRLMFVSCHPVLPPEQRAALTLRLLGGLTAAEVARAFLVTEPVMTQRLADAKRTLAEAGVGFELPAGPELAARLASVLEVVYLIFNEGYSATSGDDLMRADLALEALRLGRVLAELAPDHAEVHGLVALMEIQQSRAGARTGPGGEPVPLHEQNRGRWDPLLIRRGFAAMLRARALGQPPGPYVLQAAIAVSHAQAPSAAETDWVQIAALYGLLVRLLPSPVVRLNRALAVGMAHGADAGLALTDDLTTDPTLRNYHPLSVVRGDLLVRLGRHTEASAEFERAAALTRNSAEREFLLARAGEAPAPAAASLGPSADAFLARGDLSAATVRSYAQTLRRLCVDLGRGTLIGTLSARRVAQLFGVAWGDAAAKTWNRHVAAARSFASWTGVSFADGLERRDEVRVSARAIADLDAVLALDAAPRERAFWRVLAESGASATTALSLDVGELDGDGARGLRWSPATTALLRALTGSRTAGPVFLTDRRPGPGRMPGPADLCPHTGRARLSYERAEYLFKTATGGRYTLHLLSRAGR